MPTKNVWVALAVSVLMTLWFSHSVDHEVQLSQQNAGDSLLRAYSKETKLIDEPMDAEDGSLYNAPFRLICL